MPRSLVGATTLALLSITATCAYAVSDSVKIACRNDYFAYCSEHAVDSPSLRICMRKAHSRLSQPCLRELARSNEISKADIKRLKSAGRL
jgi:adenylate kinase